MKKSIAVFLVFVFVLNGINFINAESANLYTNEFTYGVIFEGMPADGQKSVTSNGVTVNVPQNVSDSKALLKPPSNDRVGATISFDANNTLSGIVRYTFFFKTGSESPEIMAGINDWLSDGHRAVIDSSLRPNTQNVLEYEYNTTTAEYEIYLNGVKKAKPSYSPNPFRGMRNVTLGAYKKGSLAITNIKVAYEQYTGREWGTYFDGLPESGFEKNQNGAYFYIDAGDDCNVTNSGKSISITSSVDGYAGVYLEYEADNTKNGIVRYEYTVKTSQYVPDFKIEYYSDNTKTLCAEIELLPDTERSISLVCNTNLGKWNIYVDDESLNDGSFNTASGIDKVCLLCTSSGTENETIKITDVRIIYEEDKEPVSLNLSSIQESEIFAKAKLGKDIVFMSNCDYYFASKKKSLYSSSDASAYMDDELGVMVTLPLVAETLGVQIAVSGDKLAVDGVETDVGYSEKDGKIFVPAGKIARDCLSRYVYEDTRGFVLISTLNRGYSNSINSMDTLENSDYIYRYMQFERPDGDKIYEDVKRNSYRHHPRMFIRKEEIPAFYEKLESDAKLRSHREVLINACEFYYEEDLVKYEKPDGLRLFNSCYKVKLILTHLGMGYLVTGNEKYRDRMWEQMQNALSWKDWNLENHFLDSGEIGPAIAFAYDILYDRLTPSQRRYVRDSVEELYLDFAVGVYTGDSSFSANDGRLTRTNWGAVCANSMLMCALTFIDDEPEDSEFTQKCKFIAKCALQSHEFPLEVPFPDGDISEGIVYWSYFVESLGWSIESLINMCGTDYGLLNAPGYRQMADFELYVQTPNGIYAHCDSIYNDVNIPIVPETYLIAKFYGDDALMQALDGFREMMRVSYGAFGLLWYEPPKGDGLYDDYPLDKHFSQSISVMRSDWSGTSSYLGVSCGIIHSESHLDKGSFMYENQGERWFVDIGSDNYNIDGYHSESGYRLYRKRAEGHNTLVINPKSAVPDQILYSSPYVTRFESGKDDGIIVCNLTDSYRNDVKYYNRGFYMGEGKNTLIVQDELEFINDDNDIYYFLHTEGDITLHPDGKGATISRNGKKLRLDVICDAKEWKLEVRDTMPLFPENSAVGEYSRQQFRKLTIAGKADGKLNISVKMRPEDSGVYKPHTFVPISGWELTSSENNDIEYGNVFSLNPATDILKKGEHGAYETIIDNPGYGSAVCEDGKINIETSGTWKAVDSRLIFEGSNSLSGILRYKFKIRPEDYIPSTYVKYFSGSIEQMVSEITSYLKPNTQSEVEFLYYTGSGKWILKVDAMKVNEGTVNPAEGIDCAFIRCMSPDDVKRKISVEDASIDYGAFSMDVPEGINISITNNKCTAEFIPVVSDEFVNSGNRYIYAIAAYIGDKLAAVDYQTIIYEGTENKYLAELDISAADYDRISAYLWTDTLCPVAAYEN